MGGYGEIKFVRSFLSSKKATLVKYLPVHNGTDLLLVDSAGYFYMLYSKDYNKLELGQVFKYTGMIFFYQVKDSAVSF